MRSEARQRRYLARPWLLILRPLLRYSISRDAYVLRGIGNFAGPVLRPGRGRRGRRERDGADRSSARAA